jgi:hypothetical protein
MIASRRHSFRMGGSNQAAFGKTTPQQEPRISAVLRPPEYVTTIMSMSGRGLSSPSFSAKGTNQNDLNFLAVWREEYGRWKFPDGHSSTYLPPTTIRP